MVEGRGMKGKQTNLYLGVVSKILGSLLDLLDLKRVSSS